MCKEWFRKKQPVITAAEHRLLTFRRNKYGGGNDLNGCVNDSHNIAGAFTKAIPGIVVHKYLDYSVTEDNYLKALDQSIALLPPGATVIMIMDSCYSGTATRNGIMTEYRKNRFIGSDENIPEHTIKKVARTEFMKWIAISAARENQTASDAMIGSQYVGAFSYYAYKVLKSGMTWREWYNAIRLYLPGNGFEQEPTIEGPDFLLDRIIGQGPTLIVHNSSHGSWQRDDSGDESDSKDEGLYFDHLS